MSDPSSYNPIDELLCKAAGDPAATVAQRSHAERVLDRAIQEACLARRSIRPRWRSMMPALAGALAVILFVAVTLQVTQPSPAAAALGKIAAAAELADPLDIPDQSYAYTSSQSTVLGIAPSDGIDGRDTPLAYLAHHTREAWIGNSETVQIRTTAHKPEFFSSDDETDYYSTGLDRIDRIGETITTTGVGVTSILAEQDWPTNPGDLGVAITESLPIETGEPRNVAIVNLALVLITETGASPELRAAALHLISELDDVDLVERQPDGGGTFRIDYDQPSPTSLSFALDGDGNVLQITLTDIDGDPALGIPPGTLIADTRYNRTAIVDSLESP